MLLNGVLKETIYMEQPPSFINHEAPDHVIYFIELYMALTDFVLYPGLIYLLGLNFVCSKVDSCLFIFSSQLGPAHAHL